MNLGNAIIDGLVITIFPGLIAGVISIFTSWFWVAVVFHKYQRSTPQTWRPESAGSHILSSLIQVAACIAIAMLYVILARETADLFNLGLRGAVWFAVVSWVAFSAPLLGNVALYINLHPLVTVGLLVNWLTTALLATVITSWWVH